MVRCSIANEKENEGAGRCHTTCWHSPAGARYRPGVVAEIVGACGTAAAHFADAGLTGSFWTGHSPLATTGCRRQTVHYVISFADTDFLNSVV